MNLASEMEIKSPVLERCLAQYYCTNVECLPTEDAIASFNYLCSENRLVAAALIPPNSIKFIR